MNHLVLSVFAGIGLLDRAFEEENFCIVRGPDALWGGEIKTFHPPAGPWGGLIGGPPCQAFSSLSNYTGERENLIPEFERVVAEAQPEWFLMENVREAPTPSVVGYQTSAHLLNNRWLGEEQNRLRRFSFGTRDGRRLYVQLAALEAFDWKAAVTAAQGGERRTHFNSKTGGKIQRYTVEEALELQGLPPDFFARYKPRSPLTRYGQLKVLAQGVPLPMGRAVARAVKRAMGYELEEMRGGEMGEGR